MRRVYNEKISQKANDSLNQRARKVMIQKRVIAIACILIVSLLILLGSRFIDMQFTLRPPASLKCYIQWLLKIRLTQCF